jgi:GT2 family glycosyltransferase
MPRLAVVIVSYNTWDLLRSCLRSVFASATRTADRLDVDVVVVDNASQDGSAAMVADEFPGARLVPLDDNLGFTGGNNLALILLGFDVSSPFHPVTLSRPHPVTLSSPDYVLLLNPDAEVQEDALWRMVAFMEETPDAGACGARLSYGDGGFQHGAFYFPGLFQVGLDLFPLAGLPGAHRLHDSRLNGRYPMALWMGERLFPVDFVLGAAMLVRGEAIRQVGGLDDEFFMYCEEMDWAMRLHEAGWRVYALPAAHVIHHAGQSSQQVRWPAFVRLWRSRFRFFDKHRRHYPPGYPRLVRALVRNALALRARQARQRFARGAIRGDELADELNAYTAILG